MSFRQRSAANATPCRPFACAGLARQAFVEALACRIAPPPADMARIVDANLRGLVPA